MIAKSKVCFKHMTKKKVFHHKPMHYERMSFIARYVYTHEDFVIVTEAPQCIRQDTDDKRIIYE